MNARSLRVIVTTSTLTALVHAQESSPKAPPSDDGSPRRERIVSARVAAMLAAATPKFVPPEPTATNSASETGPARVASNPTEGVVRMPTYIVRDRRLPTAAEVNPSEVARQAMERYLGPEDGFDRGFLNLFTSAQIPILGLIGSVPNEVRAMSKYREEEQAKLKADLMDLAAWSKQTGDGMSRDKLKREIEATFRPK